MTKYLNSKKIFSFLFLAVTILGVAVCFGSSSRSPTFKDLTLTLTTADEIGRTNNANATASGVAYLQYSTNNGEIKGYVTVSGFTPTTAHIHKGAMGTNGDPKITLTKNMTDPNRFDVPAGSKVDSISNLKANLYYINVHSVENPGGEVRAQIITKGTHKTK